MLQFQDISIAKDYWCSNLFGMLVILVIFIESFYHGNLDVEFRWEQLGQSKETYIPVG